MYKNGKKTVILDLTDCWYWIDFHERIRIAFDFPEYYGQNWALSGIAFRGIATRTGWRL